MRWASTCAGRRTRTADVTWRSAWRPRSTCSWYTRPPGCGRSWLRRSARAGLRGHHGQACSTAPYRHLDIPLARLAQGQGRTVGRIRDRRLHARQGRARPARCPAAGLLARQAPAVRRACRLGPRRSEHRHRQPQRTARPARKRAHRSPAAPPLHRPTSWLKPELVAEVSFSEWTPDGALRAPVFLRLRDDIAAASVRRTSERSGGRGPARAARLRPAIARRRSDAAGTE